MAFTLTIGLLLLISFSLKVTGHSETVYASCKGKYKSTVSHLPKAEAESKVEPTAEPERISSTITVSSGNGTKVGTASTIRHGSQITGSVFFGTIMALLMKILYS